MDLSKLSPEEIQDAVRAQFARSFDDECVLDLIAAVAYLMEKLEPLMVDPRFGMPKQAWKFQ